MEAVTAPREAPALDSPELFENRELSWLQFNERVLELAEDEHVPLLERVKFLAIYANNLDEFFMVRVAGLHDQVDAGIDARGPDGLSARETLERITEQDAELGRRHSRAWEGAVRPTLAEHGIRVVDVGDCAEQDLEAADRLFAEQIFPVLTPLAVGPGRPFPSRAMPTSRSRTRPTTCSRPSRTSCGGGASGRSSGSRWPRRWTPTCAAT
jgi:polyphosphate kinase